MTFLGVLLMIGLWLFVGYDLGWNMTLTLILCLIFLVLCLISGASNAAWRKCEKVESGNSALVPFMLVIKTVILIVAIALANLIVWPLFAVMLQTGG